MRKDRLAVGVVAVVGIAGSLGSMWLNGRAARAESAGLVADAVEARAALERVVLDRAPESEGVAELIAGSVTSGTIAVPDRVREALGRDAAAFLARRFGPDGSARAYADWMASRGYEPRGIDELRSTWFLDNALEVYRVSTPPDEATFDEVWAAVWEAVEHEPPVAVLDVAAVARDASGYSVSIGVTTRANPAWPEGGGIAERGLQYAPRTVISPSWWRHPRCWEAQMESAGRATVAHVSLVIQVADGRRGVVCVNFVWDEQTGAWLQEGIGTDLPLRLEH